MTIYDASNAKLYGLNGSGCSPQAATIELYRELGYTTMPVSGIHTVTIPGCVDGWNEVAQRFGRLELAQVLAPAISYAEEGLAVGSDLYTAFTCMSMRAEVHRSWRKHFLPDDAVPPVGSVMRFPTLARTLHTIAKEGAVAFYRGAIAVPISAFFTREGGLITRDDLAAHRSEWVTPLSVPFAGLRIYELQPNTQGITALQTLRILDQLPLGDSPLAPETVHLAVEAKKLAFADREAYLIDPEDMGIDPATLIDPSYLARRCTLIDPARARPSIVTGSFTGDTIYLCTAERDGNVVSLIQSNYMGFGSGVVVDKTGIVLQNRGAYFSLDTTSPNALAPMKRTLHTLIPSIALRDGGSAMVFGTMGGDEQPQIHLQVYTAVVQFGLSIQEAIEMPRWIHGAATDGESIRVDSRVPPETLEILRQRGHVVHPQDMWSQEMGYA